MKSAFILILAGAGLAGCVGYGGGYHGSAGYHDPYPSYYYSSPGAYWGGTTYYYNDSRRLRDRDRDGIPNRLDRDRDNDGIPNRMDRDRDNDGVPNRQDARPNNPRRH